MCLTTLTAPSAMCKRIGCRFQDNYEFMKENNQICSHNPSTKTSQEQVPISSVNKRDLKTDYVQVFPYKILLLGYLISFFFILVLKRT